MIRVLLPPHLRTLAKVKDEAGLCARLIEGAKRSAATGGVFAAMILGHWYLVTPKLSTGPALLLSRAMLGVVAFQLVLFGLWVGLGVGTTQAPLEPLTGPWALFVWLRLLVSLVFPLIVSWAAVQTVRTRSMESATGLLYINVALIAAGTSDAAGLYFGAGLLVYRQFDWKRVLPMLVETASLSGAIRLIVGCATAMAWLATFQPRRSGDYEHRGAGRRRLGYGAGHSSGTAWPGGAVGHRSRTPCHHARHP